MADDVLLGLDIGGTKSAVVIGTEAGEVLAREEFATASHEETIRRLIEIARRLLGGRRAAGCGISCGGPLSSARGLILSPPNLPGWDRVPVVEQVKRALNVPTRLENDANVSAVAEWQWGVNRAVDHLAYLTCGTGQGAGLMLGGRLYRGHDDYAGEIGHVRLLPLGPVGYHKAGSVEGLTSGRGLARLAALRVQEPHAASTLDRLAPEQLTGKVVGEAALAGDALAIAVVKELGDYLGRACAILIDLLNVERISLGSMALRLGDLLVNEVRAAARREALGPAYEACTIAPAALGNRVQDLAALAAAMLARQDG